MQGIIRHLLLLALGNIAAVWAAERFFPGSFAVVSDNLWLYSAAVIALVMMALNGVVRPLLSLFALPFLVISTGLTMLAINGALLYLAAYILREIIPEFGVDIVLSGGIFGTALVGLIFGVGNALAHWVLGENA